MILELQHRRPDGDVDTYHLKPGRRYHLGRGSGCEVRILDLKLSRKHAALEFQDAGWVLIDLASTNGCRLNGETMVGTIPLHEGSEIEIGQTTLVIHRVVAADGRPRTVEPTPPPADGSYVSDEFHPEAISGRNRALASRNDAAAPPRQANAAQHESSELFRPANAPPADHARNAIAITPMHALPVLPASTAPTSPTPPPVPVRSPTMRRAPVQPVRLQSDPSLSLEDTVATVTPDQPRAMPPPFVKPDAPTPLASAPQIAPIDAGADDRTYFITVLGRRIGPLSRAVARDLKARELKGTLRPADLDQFPAA